MFQDNALSNHQDVFVSLVEIGHILEVNFLFYFCFGAQFNRNWSMYCQSYSRKQVRKKKQSEKEFKFGSLKKIYIKKMAFQSH